MDPTRAPRLAVYTVRMTFFCRLNPPRPTFALDLSPEEAALMEAHASHWRDWMARGHVVAFGLVGDPHGPFGIGIVEFAAEQDARAFTDTDPVIVANRGFTYDVLAMPRGVVVRGAASPA